MKSAPTPPTPPDPTVVATAQTSGDINAAIASRAMNNTNQVTPYGNLNYTTSGHQTVTLPDGTTMDVPTYTATQTLNPTEQKTLDATQQAQYALAQLAGAQTGRVASTLGSQLSFAGDPAMQQFDANGMPMIPTGLDMGQVGALQQGLDLSSINPVATSIDTSRANALSTGINLSSLGMLPTGVNARSLPSQVTGLYYSQLPQIPQGGPQQTEDNEAGALYHQAMGYLTPQFTQSSTNLDDQLSRQGIPVGSEAWVNAKTQLANSQNQQSGAALDSAIATGAAQGGTNYGLALQGVQTGVGEQTANASLANQAGQFGLSTQGLNAQIAQGAVGQILGGQKTSADVAATGAQTSLAADVASAQQGDTAAQLRLAQMVASAGQQNTAASMNLQAQGENASIANQAGSTYMQQSQLAAQMAQAARQQQISEQQYLYNLPLNQTSALLSGSQVQGPSFVNAPQSNISGANMLGAYALQQQGQQANYQAQMQNYGSGLGGLFGLAGAGLSAGLNPGSAFSNPGFLMSSRLFKMDGEPVDTSVILDKVTRLPVEKWQYKPGMADGSEHIGPYAEDFAREFGGSHVTIDVVSMLGVLVASVQELTKTVKMQQQRIADLETFLVV